MKYLALAAILTLSNLSGCGCFEDADDNCVAAPAGGNKPGTNAINTVCPVMQSDAADGSVTVTYKEKVIAFCCAGCVTKFNKMDEAGKDKVLATAMTYAK
jgi:hypothetical protein